MSRNRNVWTVVVTGVLALGINSPAWRGGASKAMLSDSEATETIGRLASAISSPVQGGDDCTSALAIGPGLPISLSGTTLGYVDDYDEACPYGGSTSPDVVYAFTPSVDVTATITACLGMTNYDTKIYVYENACPDPGNFFACNDDACVSAAGQSYVSALTSLALTGGNTYYIVIDGYGGESGDYHLDITEAELTCEGDGDCDDEVFCNGAESCVDGECVGGTEPCDSPTPYCDEDSDSCYACLDDAFCDDELWCNGAETCQADTGQCVQGTPPCQQHKCNEDDEECCAQAEAEKGIKVPVEGRGVAPNRDIIPGTQSWETSCPPYVFAGYDPGPPPIIYVAKATPDPAKGDKQKTGEGTGIDYFMGEWHIIKCGKQDQKYQIWCINDGALPYFTYEILTSEHTSTGWKDTTVVTVDEAGLI